MIPVLRAPDRADRAVVRVIASTRRAQNAANRGDRAYAVYVAVLVVLTVAPLAVAASRQLVVMFGIDAGQELPGMLLGVLTVGLVLGAQVRGPVAARLPDIDLVLSSDLDWAAVHAGAGNRWLLGSAVVGATGGAALRALSGGFDMLALLGGLAAGAGAGVVVYLWFLLAQWAASRHSPRPFRLVSAGSIVALIAVLASRGTGWTATHPAMWPAAVLGTPFPPGVGLLLSLILTVAVAMLATTAARWAARQIPREHLRGQELTWSAAVAGVVSVNPQLVSEALLRERTYFRRLTLDVLPREIPAVVARDLLGSIRRWKRSTLSFLLSSVGAGLISVHVGSLTAWLMGAALLTMASRASSVGLRAHADNLGRQTSLESQSVSSLAWHLVMPALLVGAGAAAGCIASGPAGERGGLTYAAVLLLVGICVVAQGVAAYSTQLPLYLIGPIITPVGDLSPLAIGGWIARIYLLTLTFAFLFHAIVDEGSALQLCLCAGFGWAIAALWSLRSLFRERGPRG